MKSFYQFIHEDKKIFILGRFNPNSDLVEEESYNPKKNMGFVLASSVTEAKKKAIKLIQSKNMENWYFFSAQGNYSDYHNWNNGYTIVTVEQYPSVPELNTDFGSLYEETDGILISQDSYGGNHSAWGYVLCEGPEEGKKMLEDYFEI